MANLRADINALQGVKSQVQTQIQDLESNIVTLNEVLYALKDIWDGSASKAFLESMLRYRQKAIDAMNCLVEYRDYIGKVITQLEELDRIEQEAIRRLQEAFAKKQSTSTQQKTTTTTPKAKAKAKI